jgi:hypothetical protein
MSDEAPKFCSHCGTPIVGTRFCTVCGKQMGVVPAVVAPAQRKHNTAGTIAVLLLLIVGGCAGLWVLSGGGRAGSSASFAPSPIGAWVDCRDFVTKNLKAPASAQFPLSNDPSVSIALLSNGRWAVVGYVDAQNSFGAQLRQPFTCQISYSGTTVTLQKLTLGDQTLLDE